MAFGIADALSWFLGTDPHISKKEGELTQCLQN
jgi:hypothetical protein